MHLNRGEKQVALRMKGAFDMAQLIINLPDTDSEDGVRLSTLEEYARQRGSSSTEEFVNILIADALGFRPSDPEKKQRFPKLAALKESMPND